jgi:hypothetical protein
MLAPRGPQCSYNKPPDRVLTLRASPYHSGTMNFLRSRVTTLPTSVSPDNSHAEPTSYDSDQSSDGTSPVPDALEDDIPAVQGPVQAPDAPNIDISSSRYAQKCKELMALYRGLRALG